MSRVRGKPNCVEVSQPSAQSSFLIRYQRCIFLHLEKILQISAEKKSLPPYFVRENGEETDGLTATASSRGRERGVDGLGRHRAGADG